MVTSSVQYKGVNLSGLEFGGTGGKLYYNYVVPGAEHFEYWGEQVGATIVRIPFVWERLQPQAGGPLNADYLKLLVDSVNHAKANGMTAILDVHNYGKYFGKQIGSAEVPLSQFTDMWKKLGTVFDGDSKVWLNLMNEPYDFNANTWAGYMQTTVNEMRAAGIDNKIMLSGTAWSGAHSWVKSGNASAFNNFVDPLNNFVFDVHQYLDTWSTGTTGVAAQGIGSTALVAVTQWAEQNNFKLFLGEVGAADPTIAGQQFALSELQNLFSYMEAHSGAWEGWALWGAGPWWPDNYHFNINPSNVNSANPAHDKVIQQILQNFEIIPPAVPVVAEPEEVNPDIIGTDAKDTLQGDGEDNKLYGRKGDDLLYGQNGNDELHGEDGRDYLDGGNGNDSLYGGSGDDHYLFSPGNDHVYDTAGSNDVIYLRGSAKFENLSFTVSQNDLIITDSKLESTITIHDQFGAGRIEKIRLADGTLVDIGNGFRNIVSNAKAAGLTLNVQNLSQDLLSSGEFVNITGTAFADKITGSAAASTIRGEAGDDVIHAGGGNDVVIGGKGADVLVGGDGIDTVSYAGSLGVTVDLNRTSAQTGAKTSDAYGDKLSGFENVTGSSYADNITGNGAANVLNGGGGNDTLDGGAGNDTLIGGAGADKLYGGTGTDTASYADSAAGVNVNLSKVTAQSGGDAAGDMLLSIENLIGGAYNDVLTGSSGANVLSGGGGKDTLSGGASNDVLNGCAGADILIGGTHNDMFVFSSLSHSIDSARDVITDFARGVDKIDIRGLGFSSVAAGDGSGSTLGFQVIGGNTIISDADSDFSIQVNGKIALTSADFIF